MADLYDESFEEATSQDEIRHVIEESRDIYQDESFELESPPKPAPISNPFHTGERVQVFWPDEEEWFAGTITKIKDRECYITYDDGDQQWEVKMNCPIYAY